MINKPLYQNPLAGGGPQELTEDQLKMTIFDNTPVPKGGAPMFIGKGTLEAFDMGKYEGNPYANPNFNDKTIIGNDFYGLNSGALEAVDPGGADIPSLINPGAEAQKKADEEFLKTADEYQKGFRQSEFYKPNAAMTADVAEFIYKSPTGEDITMKGSSSGIGQFGKYLDSIGKGDLLQSVGGSFSSDLLGKVNPNDPYDLGSLEIGVNPIISSGDEYEIASEQGVGQDIFGNNPSVIPVPSTPNPVQGIGLDGQPFQTTGQYLTGLNEPNNILETLKKIEQGIASLGSNFGQEGNMNQSSNYGDFDNFGIGSFFPPYGGMYG